MNKLLLMSAAGLALIASMPANAADLALMPGKGPFVDRFSWTGCYLGANVGGGWERNRATDPVQLVQDGISAAPVTLGTTTVGVNSSGVTAGGQIGCDYQFQSALVVGIEAAGSGLTMKGATRVALPANLPDSALVSVKTDFMPALTARLGYAVDHWLYYAKGGVAWAADKYSVTGTYAGTPFDFEGLNMRAGWTAGAGVEWEFADDWSAKLEYDYYDFGRQTLTMSDAANVLSGPVSFKQSAQTVKLGVNFHVWGLQ